MNGPIFCGVYREPSDDQWYRVEVRHYPRRRFVAVKLDRNHRPINKETPELTPELWEKLVGWL